MTFVVTPSDIIALVVMAFLAAVFLGYGIATLVEKIAGWLKCPLR